MKQSVNDNEIIFFNSNDGQVKIDVLYADENIWLTQKKMAELFETTTQNITLHLKHIYEDKELNKDATCKDYLQVQKEGIRAISRNGWIRVISTKKKQIVNNTPFVPKEDEPLERVDNSSYQIGTIVSHQTFGNGKIIGKECSGDNLILTVLFSNGQEKKLLAKFANLTIIK